MPASPGPQACNARVVAADMGTVAEFAEGGDLAAELVHRHLHYLI